MLSLSRNAGQESRDRLAESLSAHIWRRVSRRFLAIRVSHSITLPGEGAGPARCSRRALAVPGLVNAHQPAVAGDIGGQNGSKPARRVHGPSRSAWVTGQLTMR